MKLSLRQAAAAEVGKSKSTILRSIQSGRLSADRTEDGGWAIDPAELFRVYDARSGAHTGAEGQDAPHELAGEIKALQAQLEALRDTVRRLDDQVVDLKSQRDGWQKQAETANLLLTDERKRREQREAEDARPDSPKNLIETFASLFSRGR